MGSFGREIGLLRICKIVVGQFCGSTLRQHAEPVEPDEAGNGTGLATIDHSHPILALEPLNELNSMNTLNS